MDDVKLAKIKERLQGDGTVDLISMVGADRDGWRPDVIELAEAELRTRGFSEEDLDEFRRWEERLEEDRAHHIQTELIAVAEADADGSRCHLCDAAVPSLEVPFALAAIDPEGPELNVGMSALLSVITVPLMGFGLAVGRDKGNARTINLRLRLCHICDSGRRALGTRDLIESDYRMHPGYARAESIGFERLLIGGAADRSHA